MAYITSYTSKRFINTVIGSKMNDGPEELSGDRLSNQQTCCASAPCSQGLIVYLYSVFEPNSSRFMTVFDRFYILIEALIGSMILSSNVYTDGALIFLWLFIAIKI